MRSILEVYPTTNAALASPTERWDTMDSLARALMGLGHELQLVSQARATDPLALIDWPHPPRLERRWYAVVTADDAPTLEWRTRTVKDSLEGVGLRCAQPVIQSDIEVVSRLTAHAVLDADGYWTASLVLRRWPREVAPGWLGQALAGDLPVDVAIHVKPQDAQKTARFLKKQQAWQTDTHSPRPDAGNQLGREDAERVRRNLIARTDKPCRVAIVFTVRATTRDLLKQRVETLKHECALTLADVRETTFEHDRGLEATSLHGAMQLLGAWRTLDCTSVASTGLFQPATVNHSNGAELGTTHHGSMLVRLDPFDMSLESFGIVVLAKVGSGKSFVLKLLARRLKNVEILIVEQRSPGEYGGVPGARVLNLAASPYRERATVLREFVSDLWETAKRDPRPRLLILDELWSLLQDPELASLVEEVARIGRHHFLSLAIASQQVQEMVSSDQGLAVLNNAAIKVYLKQNGPDGELLAEKMRLSNDARRFLRGAARGQALLDVGGMLVPVDIQASPAENILITTDPREKAAA